MRREGKWLDMDGPLKNNIDPDVILVVDDDSTYAKMLERALRLAGFMCLSAGNAADAIKILKNIKVDVVVSDIVMPMMNGVQFTEIIKNNFDSDVILITGYADEFDFPEIIEKGATDFIEKPFSIKELVIRTRRILRERKLVFMQNQTEKELLESRKRIEEFLNNIDAIVLECDPFEIRYIGGRTEQLLGYPKQQWLEDPDGARKFWEKHLHPDCRGDVIKRYQMTVEGGRNFSMQYKMISADGRGVWFQESVTVECRDGIPIRARSVMIDISNIKKAKRMLRIAREEDARLKTATEALIQEHDQRVFLSKKIIELLEEERRDISWSLHEDISQVMCAVGIDLELMKRKLKDKTDENFLKKIQKEIKSSMECVRNISYKLRPSELDCLGLIESLNSLINDVENSLNKKICFSVKDIPKRMNPQKELAIYRIAQEALANIHRHAHADTISVELTGNDPYLLLTIKDNGSGFKDNDVKSEHHLGIMMMRERAVQMGGELRIDSRVRRGTRVIAKIPMD